MSRACTRREDVINRTGQHIDDEDDPGGCGPGDDIQAVSVQHALLSNPFDDVTDAL